MGTASATAASAAAAATTHAGLLRRAGNGAPVAIAGTAVAALSLALVEVFAVLVIPAYLTAAVGFVLLVLVLVLRPGGLFGQRVLG